jgi:hypothetical protein
VLTYDWTKNGGQVKIGKEEFRLRPGLPRSASKEDDRGLLLIPQSQEAAKIGVGGNQATISARGPSEYFAVGCLLHAVVAHVNCIAALALKTLGPSLVRAITCSGPP